MKRVCGLFVGINIKLAVFNRTYFCSPKFYKPSIISPKITNNSIFPVCNFKFQQFVSMSSSSDASLSVEHDPSSNKFFIKLGTDEAKLEYVKKGNVLNMWHTEVPPALQGKGIAKILAQEAFGYAVKNNLKMKLSCSYLQKFYKDNPKEEYKSQVVI